MTLVISSSIHESAILTLRRRHIDLFIQQVSDTLSGRTLDLGGENTNSRSKNHLKCIKGTIITANIDLDCQPDVVSDALFLPFADQCFDNVVMFETLEHITHPEKALSECLRVMKPEAKIFITMPFLYQVHGDPDDFQRWTESKLFKELKHLNFCNINIQPMGGILAVIFDLAHSYAHRCSAKRISTAGIFRKLLKILAPYMFFLDNKLSKHKTKITTGWHVIAQKM